LFEDNRKTFKNPLFSQTKSPERGVLLFLDLFVFLLGLTPFTILFELNFASDKLFVLAAPIVDALAGGTGEFYKFILGHIGLS
jgi:hypothetical protein